MAKRPISGIRYETTRARDDAKGIDERVLSDEEAALFEQYHRLGLKKMTLDDITWLGEDVTPFDPEEILAELETEGLLAELCRRIVSAKRSDEWGPIPKSRTEVEDRVQVALDALLGRRPNRGRPQKPIFHLLLLIAERYFAASYALPPGRILPLGGEDTVIGAWLAGMPGRAGSRLSNAHSVGSETVPHRPSDQTLDSIIRTVLRGTGADANLDEEARKNLISLLRREFKARKNRLITYVTSDAQEALSRRRGRVGELIEVLTKCGILPSDPHT